MRPDDVLLRIAGPIGPAIKRLRLSADNSIADVYIAYAGADRSISGFLVTGRASIDEIIAFCPLLPGLDTHSEEWARDACEQFKIAVRVAAEPSLSRRARDVIWLGNVGAQGRRVPGWLYALQCIPLTRPWDGALRSPRPFCPETFERMAAQPHAAQWLREQVAALSPPARGSP